MPMQKNNHTKISYCAISAEPSAAHCQLTGVCSGGRLNHMDFCKFRQKKKHFATIRLCVAKWIATTFNLQVSYENNILDMVGNLLS